MIWFLISLASSFVWFSAAMGYFTPSPWLTTFAFFALGVGCVLNGIKELLKWAGQ